LLQPDGLAQERALTLSGIATEDGDGGTLEVDLTVRVRPDDSWLAAARASQRRRDWFVTVLFVAVPVFAVVGVTASIRWLLGL